MISFLLNDQLVELAQCPSDQTVLTFLREQNGLTGTKEGCASGDCGACTAVVLEQENGKPVYRSINTCIAFTGSLQGKHLITVEYLAKSGEMHPVQQAMVEHHASQCGFCTPGFVMSLYALAENNRDNPRQSCDRELVEHAIAGNLCRCTGYRPIVDAGIQALSTVRQIKPKLPALLSEDSDSNGIAGYQIPHTLDELAQTYSEHPDAQLVAGGTDLALEVTQKLRSLPKIIDLGKVKELSSVLIGNATIELGAGCSLQQCSDVLKPYYPSVSFMLLRFGSAQIRNHGTIGGNIGTASPIGDFPPVLMALDASVVLQSVAGTRTVSLDDYFKGYRETDLRPSEFIKSILIPTPDSDQFFRVYKVSKRMDDDISAVCLAISQFKDKTFRIALGGMAEIPKRALAAEKILSGSALTQSLIEDAGVALEQDFAPISDARASAEYRMQVAQNLLQRFYLDLNDQAFPIQVSDVK